MSSHAGGEDGRCAPREGAATTFRARVDRKTLGFASGWSTDGYWYGCTYWLVDASAAVPDRVRVAVPRNDIPERAATTLARLRAEAPDATPVTFAEPLLIPAQFDGDRARWVSAPRAAGYVLGSTVFGVAVNSHYLAWVAKIAGAGDWRMSRSGWFALVADGEVRALVGGIRLNAPSVAHIAREAVSW